MQIPLCLLLCCLACRLSAAERMPEHPRLFFTAAELPGLRKKFHAPAFADYRKRLLLEADSLMKYRGEDGQSKPGTAYKLWAQRRDESLCALLWAHLLTGENAYRDKLLEVARLEMENFHFDPTRFQEEFSFMQAAFMAAIYDSLYTELSEADRAAMRKYLDSSIPSLFALKAKGGSWGFENNVGAVFFSAAGIAALARSGETAEADKILAECLAGLGDFQKNTLAAHPDGAYPESSLYWDFGLTWYLAFADALKRAAGSERGLLNYPFFENNVRYVETLLGGNQQLFTFGDTQPMTFGAAIGARLGARYDQPLMRWLADENMRLAAAGQSPQVGERPFFHELAFLWRDAAAAPKERPPLPVMAILDSVQWGVLRSDGRAVPSLEIGVKGNPGATLNHNPPDAGSFVVLAGGEPVLLAPGYYQGDLENHNVLIVRGAEPRGDSLATLTEAKEGGLKEMTLTLQKRDGSARVFTRIFVMAGGNAAIILDDVPTGHALARFQPAMKPEPIRGETAFLLAGKTRRWRLQCFGPADGLTVQGPRDFGKSWVFADLARRGRLAWYTLGTEYDANPETPEITVLNAADRKETASGAQVTRSRDAAIVTLPGGEKVRFSRQAEGTWKVSE